MRTPLLILAGAIVFAGCSSGTRVIYLPAPSPATAPEPAPLPPVGIVLAGVSDSRVQVSTNQHAYVALFEIVPDRGVTLVYPVSRRQRQAEHAGSSWLPVSWQWSRDDDRYSVSSTGSGGFGGGIGRPARPTVRYVYAIASERPLRITDRALDDDYLRQVLVTRAWRTADPYEVIEKLSRHFVPAQHEEDWGEDLLEMDLVRPTRPMRTARVYCPDGSVVHVRDDIADRGWCPPATGRRTGRAGSPWPRADSVVASSGRPVIARRSEPRMRPPVYRIPKHERPLEGLRDVERTAATGGKGDEKDDKKGKEKEEKERKEKQNDDRKDKAEKKEKGDNGNHYGRDSGAPVPPSVGDERRGVGQIRGRGVGAPVPAPFDAGQETRPEPEDRATTPEKRKKPDAKPDAKPDTKPDATPEATGEATPDATLRSGRAWVRRAASDTTDRKGKP